MKRSVCFASILFLSLLCGCESMDYDHQQGLTSVKHGKASYKVYAEQRKQDKQLKVTIEPVSDNTSLCVTDCQYGKDKDGVEWFVVYLDVKYKREPGVTEHYIDNASVKVAAVDEFSQKGTPGGTIPSPNGKITIVYNGAVTFDDNFQFKYFKDEETKPQSNLEHSKVQPQPKLEVSQPKQ